MGPDFLEFANALHKFSSRINQVQRIGMNRYHLTSYSELDLQERQRIAQINSRLNEMEVVVKQRLDEIDAQMRSQSKDAGLPLCDREYIVRVQAFLRHTDPAYCDECDNFVADI